VRASFIVIAVACLFAGGLLLLIGGRTVVDTWRYRQAIHAEAAATGTALRPATDATSTEYEVSYQAIIDGQAHDRTEVVPVDVWERAETTSRVPVQYLAGRPETLRAESIASRASARSYVFAAAGLVLILGGLIAVVSATRRRSPADEAAAVPPPIAIPVHESSYWPRARQSSGFWLGAIALIVASPLVIAALLQIREEWQFARTGVSTDGLILTKRITLPGRNQPSRRYEITYRLTVPEGAFEKRVKLSYDEWSRLRERQTVEVVYLPRNPVTSRLNRSGEWMQSVVMGLVATLFFTIGATFFGRSLKRARLEWRLFQRGAAATATVIDVRDRRLKINGVGQWRLTFEYDDFQARRHSGTHDVPEDEARIWKVGDRGAVRYDPGRPADAIWLGRDSPPVFVAGEARSGPGR
jgi:hypothetical protein